MDPTGSDDEENEEDFDDSEGDEWRHTIAYNPPASRPATSLIDANHDRVILSIDLDVSSSGVESPLPRNLLLD